jgi:hypothetical protein
MTVNELISELNAIVENNPTASELPVFFYDSNSNEIAEITSVDYLISDRIDLNGLLIP